MRYISGILTALGLGYLLLFALQFLGGVLPETTRVTEATVDVEEIESTEELSVVDQSGSGEEIADTVEAVEDSGAVSGEAVSGAAELEVIEDTQAATTEIPTEDISNDDDLSQSTSVEGTETVADTATSEETARAAEDEGAPEEEIVLETEQSALGAEASAAETEAVEDSVTEQAEPTDDQQEELAGDQQEELPDDQNGEVAEDVEVAAVPRLPTVNDGTDSSDNLIDRRRGVTVPNAADVTASPNISPFVAYSAEVEATSLPKIGVLLEPDGPVDLDISEISVPSSILVAGNSEEAQSLYRTARANGHEVFATLRPDDVLAFTTAEAASENLKTLFDALPEAIGFAQDPISDLPRNAIMAVQTALGATGRSYLEFSSGLQTGTFGQTSLALPQGAIELGVVGEITPSSVSRALERASLVAAQNGSVIVILPLQRVTLDALEAFQVSQKGQATALVPVSLVIAP